VAPGILGDDRSVGASQTELARQNVAGAQNLQTPIQLTQGQATRNAAQMSDEYNMARTDGEGVAAPLAALQRQQQALLHQNLEQVADSLDRSEPLVLNTDEEFGRSIKNTLQRREAEAKAKTGALYDQAEKQGAMDMPIAIGGLDGAFEKLKQDKFHIHESGKFGTLENLAEEFGVIGGRPTSINNVEQFRQNINRTLNDITNPNHAAMAKILKKAVDKSLDDAPDSAAAYKRARSSYARDKRETDGNALVTQITGRKGRTQSDSTADEKVYRTIITAPISDAKKMLRSLAKTDGGVNMIHNIGQRRMMDLIDAATKTDGSFNSAQFAKEIKKLDQSGRLEALYGPSRAEELRNIAEVGRNINTLPYGNYANVSQSGNTMIKRVADVIGRGPILGPLARKAGNKYNDWAQTYETEIKVKKALDIEGILSYKDQ
jgi:23S rRNA pseudoU1915 N3-methylase RlmH